MSGLDKEFQRYFTALDRSRGQDRCYLCRRTPAEVKGFFGFDEDGVPSEAEDYGLEDVVLEQTDIMSYRGTRPICAVCQLNYDAIFMLEEHQVLRDVLGELEHERESLWPKESGPPAAEEDRGEGEQEP